MNIFAYDVEVYQNFFSATFSNVNEPNENYVFYIHDNHSDYGQLRYWLKHQIGLTLVGFNSLHYDNIILNAAIKGGGAENITYWLWWLSNTIINRSRLDTEMHPKVKELKYEKVNYLTIDVMKIMAFDKLGVGLKQVAVLLGWPNIQDLPYPINYKIKEEDIPLLLEYNANDVDITKHLYWTIKPRIDMRADMSKVFKVGLTNASDSRMANLLLNNIYAKQTNQEEYEFIDLRTPRDKVSLAECISPSINFTTEPLINLLNTIKSNIVYATDNFKFKYDLHIGGITYDIGIGGLHSRDEPQIFKAKDGVRIIDADVASFYPNIMLINNIRPEHLGDDFLRILKDITKQRLQAKKKKNMVKANGLKITINSIFGKLGSQTYWLYDPKAMLSVTINGQLYLLMLIERLLKSGIEVLSANTDGIVCSINADQEEKYNKVCEQWEKDTEFELEFTDYDKYVRRDVNNYIAIKPDGNVKTKGIFEPGIDLLKPNPALGYRMPIVSKALYDYFVHGTSPEDTINNATDIKLFLLSQKVSRKFKTKIHYIENGEKVDKNLQTTNRYFIANNGGVIFKTDGVKEISIIAREYVEVVNKIDDNEDYISRIKKEYYLKEIYKTIDKIEGNKVQLTLF